MADEYIKREDAIARSFRFYWRSGTLSNPVVSVKNLKDIPAADVVPVVRCKDCRYCGHDAIFGQDWCNGQRVTPDYFCADGERESDAEG